MKSEKDGLERLLDKNAAEQLAKVDWDRLTGEISARLDHAPQTGPMSSRYVLVFKIAAGVAAAVVLAAVMSGVHELFDLQIPPERFVAVESVGKQRAILIQVKDASGKVLAMVQEGRTDKGAVKCDVEIIDRDGDLEAESDRAAWIIISAPRQTLVENGQNREEADLVCLL